MPPHWLTISVLLEIALDRWVPVIEIVPRPISYGGAVFIVCGALLALWAARLFAIAKTGIVPFSESTSLVTGGPYRFTRNPMYLGMVIVLLGLAVILGSLTPFFVVPAFVVLITYLFILPEEGHMERTFGEAYLERKRRVRRWI
jgi:protein-S-isoprenylcysteine O-methyltransferase Ste14